MRSPTLRRVWGTIYMSGEGFASVSLYGHSAIEQYKDCPTGVSIGLATCLSGTITVLSPHYVGDMDSNEGRSFTQLLEAVQYHPSMHAL